MERATDLEVLAALGYAVEHRLELARARVGLRVAFGHRFAGFQPYYRKQIKAVQAAYRALGFVEATLLDLSADNRARDAGLSRLTHDLERRKDEEHDERAALLTLANALRERAAWLTSEDALRRTNARATKTQPKTWSPEIVELVRAIDASLDFATWRQEDRAVLIWAELKRDVREIPWPRGESIGRIIRLIPARPKPSRNNRSA